MTTKSVRIVSNAPAVDERGYNRASVVVLHSDMHNAGNWNQFISTNTSVAAGTCTYDQGAGTQAPNVNFCEPGTPTLGVVAMQTIVGATGKSGRVWLADRVGQNQPALLPGYNEMMYEARVRLEFGSNDADIEMRCGFQTAHEDPGAMSNAVCFICRGNKSTWSVQVRRIWVGDGSGIAGTNEFSKEVDTGISVADWHTLKVEISKTGDCAVFYIDGKAVHVQYEGIPNWLFAIAARKASAQAFDPASIRTANLCMMPGTAYRYTSGLNPPAIHSLYCDWATFKYYR